jgi:hypothetical protein
VSGTTFTPMRSLESAPDRVWTAWRSEGRFTKNPDVVQLPDGRLNAEDVTTMGRRGERECS